jgi:ABC-type uncharacterized transport system permease subunit
MSDALSRSGSFIARLAARSPRSKTILNTLGALLASVVIVGLIFVALGADPFDAFEALFRGAYGNDFIFGQTIMVASLLALTALAAAIPFTASLWNVGGEGQLFAGAFAAVAVALILPPHTAPLVLAGAATVASGLAGAFWGFIPGFLKARFDVNEVIVSLMMTFIAILLCDYAISTLWPEGASRGTKTIPDAAVLPTIWDRTPVNAGALIALVAVLVAAVLMARTRLGFEIRASGLNSRAARLSGIPVRRALISSFAIGGMFGGLAGGIAVLGINHALISGFSASFGYLGIAVALVARLKPLWIIPSAFLFATFNVGSGALQVTAGLSPTIGQLIAATFIILLLAFHVIRMSSSEAGA